MTTAEMVAIFAPSTSVTYDWEPQSGGILITKLQQGTPIGSVLLIGDDHLIALEMMGNANEKYTAEQVLADLYGSY